MPPERRPRCYVVSLKYSPGLAKEFLLFGDELARRGLQPVFLVSREYEWLMPPEAETHYLVERSDKGTVLRSVAASTASVVARIRSAWREHPPVLLLLYNFHPLNLVLTALALRYSPRGLRALFLHEPHVAHKLEFFGVRGGAVVAAVEAGQKAVLRMCNEVIFPSPNAQSQFERLAPWFRGHRRVAALLVPDSDEAAPQERRVVGFYGHMDNRNKGLADFTRLLEAAGRTLHPPRFRLETATNLKTWHDALSPAARMCLELVQRKQLTDANIDQAMRQSIAVLLLHRHIAQSGVLPVAYKNSTPVIARDLPGFRQHVTDGVTGKLVPPDAPADAWLEAIEWVTHRHQQLGPACRRRYESDFAPQCWERYYGDLVGNCRRR